jgi:hypothetical protein
MRLSHRQYRTILPFVACLSFLQFGCHIPAQLAWSPDGSRAAYRVGQTAYVIDKDGAVLEKLGASPGGFAWSGDGKRLYYASAFDEETNPKPVPTVVDRDLFQGPVPPFEFKSRDNVVAIRVLEDRKPRDICRLSGELIHVALSPDESWLAAMVMFNPDTSEPLEGDEEQDTGSWLDLYAISLRDGTVHLVAHVASFGMAFTGPDRLAYVEREPGKWTTSPISAKLVEASLKDAAGKAPRTKPFRNENVPLWIRAQGEDFWLMALSMDAAKKAQEHDTEHDELPVTLYRFTRTTGKLTKVAENLSTLLTVSPNGKRLLAMRTHKRGEDKTYQLIVMNADGSNLQIVRTTEKDNLGSPLFPSWRDDNHLILPSAHMIREDGDKDNIRHLYSIEEYEVGEDNQLKRIRAITQKWPNDMLPFTKTPGLGKPIERPAEVFGRR